MGIKIFILTYLFFSFGVRTVFATTIKINEFYAAGTTSSNPDWVEIYNDGADISQYQLRDSSINNKKDLAGATCNGNYCTIDWYNYLNNSGDTIKLVLKAAIDSPIDQVIYGNNGDISIPSSGQSAIRNPDGTGSWAISSSSTKGSPNNPSAPSPITTPTPIPTPTPTSTTSPTPFSSTSSFTISNSPSQINSDQSFTISVNLSLPNNPNTIFYLKGTFKKSDGSNYFGLTKVSNSWVKNGSSYSSQYPITTDTSGNWSGNLEIQPDSEDSGFSGSGDYIFKIARYTSSGSGPTWSNESNINIIQSNMSTNQGITDQQTTTNNAPPSNSESSTPSPTYLPKTTLTKSTSVPKFNYQIGSVAAATASATPSAKVEVKNQKQINTAVWIGLVLVFAGVSSLGYIYLRKR